jgi:tripartite-type tricarboxylate transporter receptor subunit TctC
MKVVVPYAPEGSADIAARRICEGWGNGVGAVIGNKGRAGGNIAVDNVAKAQAEARRLAYRSHRGRSILRFTAAVRHFQEFGAHRDGGELTTRARSEQWPQGAKREGMNAKAKAEPSKMTYGLAGGWYFHIAAELFNAVANTSIVHIPCRGGGPAVVGSIDGQADVRCPVLSAAAPHIHAGKL